MRKRRDALGWLRGQHESGSTAWYYQCERLQRTAFGVEPARYSSASLHFDAVPKEMRLRPRPGEFVPGQLVIFRNRGAGHIVTVKSRSGNAWTNDYTGHGKVGVANVATLIPWCGAYDWYACDPWWGGRWGAPMATQVLPVAVRFRKSAIGRVKAGFTKKRVARRERGSVMMVTGWRRKGPLRRVWLRNQHGTWWNARRTNWKSIPAFQKKKIK